MGIVLNKEGQKNVETDMHGDWMIVTRKKRNHITGKDISKKGMSNIKNNIFLGLKHIMNTDNQWVSNGNRKSTTSSPNLQRASSAVKDPKSWVKPKNRRHDHRVSFLTANQSLNSSAVNGGSNLMTSHRKGGSNIVDTKSSLSPTGVVQVQPDEGNTSSSFNTSTNMMITGSEHLPCMDDTEPPDLPERTRTHFSEEAYGMTECEDMMVVSKQPVVDYG